MNNAIKLKMFGQSVWYDNIRRSLIEDGALQERIERREIYGVTSNPSIFMKAISQSDDYDADLQTMSWAGLDAETIFYRLAIQDIQDVADLFRPYYDASDGADGFVSLEVNPKLAHDTDSTVEEALWLWEQVDRPNLMVKIPATKAGLPAITEAIAAGVNINVTLIFSRQRYREVMQAYLEGIERRVAEGLEVAQIASVASFFVSRLETKADQRLQTLMDAGGAQAATAQSLKGKMAVANTRLAYQDYLAFFESDRFEKVAQAGAQKQRPLWASTSTKDPAYSDIKYVESLIAENTVNTIPPETLEAYLDQGEPALSIYDSLDEAKRSFETLASLDISIDEITQELEDEGVEAFAKSFESLMEVIERRRRDYVAGLGNLAGAVAERVAEFEAEEVIARMHRIDPTIWTDDPDGWAVVQKRLGWLRLPQDSQSLIDKLEAFAARAKEDGFEKVLLMGMGGSSLASETMALALDEYLDGMTLKILDSTLPAQIRAAESWVDYEKTLFIVASKSGTTIESLSLFHYFWDKGKKVLGTDTGKHFIAITDPGTPLTTLGEARGFRAVLTCNPNVGGRYSALTQFGLAPAALMGVDLFSFLTDAEYMAAQCSEYVNVDTNPGAVLGIILGEAALAGKDKLTLVSDPPLKPLGAWLGQLVAESSGKEGKGIVPVADEPLVDVDTYGADRIFVYFRGAGDHDDRMDQLREAGHPVIVFKIPYIYNLAGEFFRWELAVAIACSILGVNAFDQPDVQDNKDRTQQKIDAYLQSGELPEPEVIWEQDGIKVYGQMFPGLEDGGSMTEVISAFTSLAKRGDYIAINAYLPREADVTARLQALRQRILTETGCATTLGFGPRFLHSTGQLHKGGPKNGLFLQITQDDAEDLPIPEKDLDFSALVRAQAQGDLEALLARGQRAIRIHLPAADPLRF